MHDATSPGLIQFVLQPKHVGHAKQEAFQTGVKKKYLHAVFASIEAHYRAFACHSGAYKGNWEDVVAQSSHRGNKTRQTELRSRTLLFLRTLLLTDIHITGAQQAPLKCRAYVMANPNWLRSPDCSRAIQCMWVYVQSVCVCDTYFPLPLRQQ